MSENIENEVVSLEFDNKNFEKNIKQSSASLEKFKKELNFEEGIESSEEVGNAITKVQAKISALEVVGISALSRLTNKVIDLGEKIVKSLTIDQVASGWDLYKDKVSAVQVIFSSVDESTEALAAGLEKDTEAYEDFVSSLSKESSKLDYVNEGIQRINWSADETSSSLNSMVSALSKFTNQGIDYNTAISAVQGITYLGGQAGASASQVSNVIPQITQALGRTMNAQDWISITNASMDTKEFKETLLQNAVEAGTVIAKTDEEGTVHYYLAETAEEASTAMTQFAAAMGIATDSSEATATDTEITLSNFKDMLSNGFITADVLTGALEDYAYYADKLYDSFDLIEKAGGEDQYASTWRHLIEGYREALDDAETDTYDFGALLGSVYEDLDGVSAVLDKNLDLEGVDDAELLTMLGLPETDETYARCDAIREAISALQELSKEEYDFSRSAFYDTQQAKTLTEAIASVSTASAQQWSQIWEAIFGGYDKARVFFTDMSEELIDLFVGPLYDIKDAFNEWYQTMDGNDDVVAIWENLYAILCAVVEPFQEVFNFVDASSIKRVSSALKNITEFLIPIFKMIGGGIKIVLRTVLNTLKIGGTIIRNLWTLMSPGIEIIKGISETIFSCLNNLLEFIAAVIGGTDDIKEFAKELGLTDETVESISKAVNSIKSFFEDGKAAITEWWNALIGGDGKEEVTEGFNSVVTSISNGFTNVFTKLKNWNVWEKILDIITTISKAIKDLWNGIIGSDVATSLGSVGQSIGALFDRLFVTDSSEDGEEKGRFAKFFDGLIQFIKDIIDEITTLFDKFMTDDDGNKLTFFEALKQWVLKAYDKIKEMVSKIDADTIQNFVTMFLLFAAALWIVSDAIEKIRGWHAQRTSFGQISMALEDLASAYEQSKKAEKYTAIAGIFVGLGAFLVATAYFLNKISDLWQNGNFWPAVITLGVILAALITMVVLIVKFNKKLSKSTTSITKGKGLFGGISGKITSSDSTLGGIAFILLGMSAFLFAFASAAKKFSELDKTAITKVAMMTVMIMALIAILALLAKAASKIDDMKSFAKAISKFGTLLIKIAISFALIALAISLWGYMRSLDPAAFDDALEQIKGIVPYIAGLFAVVAVLALFNKEGKFGSFFGLSILIATIVAAVLVICKGFLQLKQIGLVMDDITMLSTMIIAILVGIGIFAFFAGIASSLTKHLGKDLISIGASLALMLVGIAAIIASLWLAKDVPMANIISVLAAIGAIIIVLGIFTAILLTKGPATTKVFRDKLIMIGAVFAIMAGSIATMIASLWLIKDGNWEALTGSIFVAFAAMMSIVLMFSYFLLVMKGKNFKDFKSKGFFIAEIFAIFSGVISVMIASLWFVKDVPLGNIISVFAGIIGITVSIALVINILMKIFKTTKSIKRGFATAGIFAAFILSLIGIIASLNLIKDVPMRNIISALVGVVAIMWSLTGVIAVMKTLFTTSKQIYRAFGSAGIFAIFMVTFIGLIASLSLIKDVPVTNIMHSVLALVILMWSIIGVIAVLKLLFKSAKSIALGYAMSGIFVVLTVALIGLAYAIKIMCDALSNSLDSSALTTISTYLGIFFAIFAILTVLAAIPAISFYVTSAALVIAAVLVILAAAFLGFSYGVKLFAEGVDIFVDALGKFSKIDVSGIGKIVDDIMPLIILASVLALISALLPTFGISFIIIIKTIISAISDLTDALESVVNVFEIIKNFSDEDFEKIKINFGKMCDAIGYLIEKLCGTIVGSVSTIAYTLAYTLVSSLNKTLDTLTSGQTAAKMVFKIGSLLYEVWEALKKHAQTGFKSFEKASEAKNNYNDLNQWSKDNNYGEIDSIISTGMLEFIFSDKATKDAIRDDYDYSGGWANMVVDESLKENYDKAVESMKKLLTEETDNDTILSFRKSLSSATTYEEIKEIFDDFSAKNHDILQAYGLDDYFYDGLASMIAAQDEIGYYVNNVGSDTATSLLASLFGCDSDNTLIDQLLDALGIEDGDDVIGTIVDKIAEKFGINLGDLNGYGTDDDDDSYTVSDSGIIVKTSADTGYRFSGNNLLLSTNGAYGYAATAASALAQNGSYGATTNYGDVSNTENNQTYTINIYGEDVDEIADKVSTIIAAKVNENKKAIGEVM